MARLRVGSYIIARLYSYRVFFTLWKAGKGDATRKDVEMVVEST